MSKIINTVFRVDSALDIAGYNQVKSYLNLIDWKEFTAPKNELDISNQVLSYHRENGKELIDITNKVEKQWHSKEDIFTSLAKNYFSVDDFPDEEYVCYPTIWPLIVRDPQKHYIAFPGQANVNDSCAIIAHELLHELFYHHLHNTFGNNIDLNSESIYDLSEVLNVLILRESHWQKEFPFDVKPYTKHVELLNRLKPIWEEKNNLDEFIKKAINIRS